MDTFNRTRTTLIALFRDFIEFFCRINLKEFKKPVKAEPSQILSRKEKANLVNANQTPDDNFNSLRRKLFSR
jgi:hypothetical protein